MRKEQFAPEECYHIYNRGVDKRTIFQDEQDYRRFILDVALFNSKNRSFNTRRLSLDQIDKKIELVDLIAYCLMPNHFHFLIREKEENGISMFMQRLGLGYARYFNEKYDRSGSLFQGPYKAKHINNDAYLLQLLRYLHLNPLANIDPNWHKNPIKGKKKIIDILEQYPWSSYKEIKERRFYLVSKEARLVLDFFSTDKEYKDFHIDWLSKDIKEIGNEAEF